MDEKLSQKFTNDGQPVFLQHELDGPLSSHKIQDFYKIRQRCHQTKQLFEDPEFPANSNSLFFTKAKSIQNLAWLRPASICKNPQFFTDGFSRFDVKQGKLGDCWFLASVACLTANSKLFDRVVCTDNSSFTDDDYAGIFHFRFWQFGKWIDVVIDDRLPTLNGQLIYLHSASHNEFWSALLEKAYAKLYGSYEAIKGGATSEALEDLTGGVAQTYDLNGSIPTANLFKIIEKGFERSSLMGCSIAPDEKIVEAKTPEGLVKGHAYSVTKVQVVDIESTQKLQLIRLRNPWGNDVEWNGAWSDKSQEWRKIPSNLRTEIGLTIENDGEFWMSFKDFLKFFNFFEICHLSPDSFKYSDEEDENKSDKEWILNAYEGEWVNGITAGGCANFRETHAINPQYILNLKEADEGDKEGQCTAIVALMQKNRRHKRNIGATNLSIGFAVCEVPDKYLNQQPLIVNFFKNIYFTYPDNSLMSDFINLREVCMRFKLPPGNYVIIPSTYLPNESGEFLLRVFTEGSCLLAENDKMTIWTGEMDENIPVEYPDKADVENIFIEVAPTSQEIGWEGLRQFIEKLITKDLNRGESQPSCSNKLLKKISTWLAGFFTKIPENEEVSKIYRFSNELYRSMIALMDTDRSGMLGFGEVMQLLKEMVKLKTVFDHFDSDKSSRLDMAELRAAFKAAGYHLNKTILNEIAHHCGSSDMTISFEDFVQNAVKLKILLHEFKLRDRVNVNQATFNMNEWITKSLFS